MREALARDLAIDIVLDHDRAEVDREVACLRAVEASVDAWMNADWHETFAWRHNAVRAAALRDLGYGWRQIANVLRRGDHSSLIMMVTKARKEPKMVEAIARALEAGRAARRR